MNSHWPEHMYLQKCGDFVAILVGLFRSEKQAFSHNTDDDTLLFIPTLHLTPKCLYNLYVISLTCLLNVSAYFPPLQISKAASQHYSNRYHKTNK
jgi:hypothetical protein